MKINNGLNVNKIMKKYNNNVNKTKETEKATMKKDKLEISSSAREFQLAMDTVKKMPDIRQEKVDKIKAQIDKGEYKPSAKEVAKKMMNRSNIIK